MLTTQSQFKAHICSEKMKCVIGDCFKNSKSVCFSNDASYLLHNTSKFANLYLFNPNFTNIARSFKISAVDSLECTSYIKRQSSFTFLYTSKDVFHAFSLKNGDGQSSTQEISVRANLQNDGFKILSPAIVLSERDEAAIAYTQQDEFHLLLIEVNDRKRSLRCLKLNDLNRPTGLLSWITRQKAPHFDNVRILPFLKIDTNNFRVLCIRDSSAGVFSVCFNEKQGSIKQAFICNTFSKAIGKEDLLLNVLVLSQSTVLLVYSAKQRLLLVKMQIQNDESSLIIDSFKTNIPVNCLKALASKENLYVSIYDEKTKTYKCFRSALSELHSLTKEYAAMEPLLQSKDPIEFTTNARQFFIISYHSIFMVEDDCILHHNISSQEIKIQSYESWVERTYSRRMKKMVQQGSYKELQQICVEKERKLIEEFSKVQRSGGKNQAMKQRLAQLIIFTHIAKLIIANRDFEQLLQNVEHPNIKSELSDSNDQNLLENTLIEQTPALIQDLLRLILRMDMYIYLNSILEEIIKHSHKDNCRDALNFIFSEICETAIRSFPQSKQYNLNQYKELLENTFDSIDVDEESFIDQLFFLAENTENSKFLHNLVLNYKLIECFKHLFLTTNIEFQAEHVTQIVSSLDQSARQSYLHDFFTDLKKAYLKEEAEKAGNAPFERVNLKLRCAILIKGLLMFREEIEGILKSTFPGLCAYFYLKHNKKHYNNQINTIAAQCRDPKVAYMLFLSTLNEHNKSELENLEKLRLQSQSAILQPISALVQQSLVN